MTRIVAGALRGLVLAVPRHIRASEEQARAALFNVLGSGVMGARVVDAFAGSGAMGLEALSRGAREVAFLESHPTCLKAIEANIARTVQYGAGGRCVVYRGDALRGLRALSRQAEPWDVVILDPPYRGSWGKKALNVSASCGILPRTGILCLEHARQSQMPASLGPLIRIKQHRYGDTVLSFYQPIGTS